MNGFVDCLCCAGSPPPRPLAYIKTNLKISKVITCESTKQSCQVESKWVITKFTISAWFIAGVKNSKEYVNI